MIGSRVCTISWAGCLGLLVACDTQAPCRPGVTVQALSHGGASRSYGLHVPSGYEPGEPAPLLLDLHGRGTWCREPLITGTREKGDREGFLVAYPKAVDDAWNTIEHPDLADDVGFLRAVVADIARTHAVDPRRVYVVGYSSGGAMAQLMGCRAAEVFAAVGSAAGTLSIAPLDCQPSRPVPVIHFHGTADDNWPYRGDLGILGAPLCAWDWSERNGCGPDATETYRQGAVHCDTWGGCAGAAEVALCTVDGMGHCWPGGLCGGGGAPDPSGAAGTELVWSFLVRVQLP